MKTSLWLLSLALAACATAPDSTTRASTPTGGMPTSTDTLARYHWQLRDAVGADNQRLDALFGKTSKPPLQLDFTSDQLSVRNACNAIGGGYRIVDDHLVTTSLRQTLMACTDATLMQRETTIKAVLQGRPTLIVSTTGTTPLLTLAAASGRTLTFAGQPTAETRYGGPGATVFLEVAPQTVPCPHPPMPDKTCLQVRERHYDANGLRVGEPGPWQPWQQEIEGYVHQPGVRNVLRVKRYTLKQPSVDASSSAYVLDMVVESGGVAPKDAAQP